MIDEKIIIDKLERMKENSKSISDNNYISKKNFQYILDMLIQYVNENVVAE